MSHRIEMAGGGVFHVSADEDTLLRGALRSGIGFPHDCSVGGCGNCRFDLVSGEMETLWAEAPGLSERERKRGRRLACQSRPTGDCVIKVRTADEYRPAVPTARLTATLVARRHVTGDIAEFTFRTEAPATFLAGQYAVLHPPGVEGVRAYSMSNLPNGDGEWRFVVRRVPGGRGSNAMFDALPIGSSLDIDGPYGQAWFRTDNDRDVVCVAGGSGIGPIVSIAGAVLREGGARKLHVFEGARTAADLCFRALMDGVDGEALVYTPVLSAEPTDGPWQGARGFVHAEVERQIEGRVTSHEFYFAGPPPMIEAMQDLLVMRWRAPFSQVHYDRFF